MAGELTVPPTALRLATVAAWAGLIVLLSAPPAAAHTRAGVATDWVSRIDTTDAVEDVEWKLYPAGEYLGMTNHGATPVTILGYDDEPYLRIGPDGVEQNLNSPTAYLNRRRDGDVAVPPRADPHAPPDWSRITSDPSYQWFDHRVHRMPGDGRASGTRWQIPFIVEGRELALTGTLTYDPGPPWWRWLVLATVAVLAAAWVASRRSGSVLRATAMVVAGVGLFNLINVWDEIAALPLSRLDIAYGVFHTLLFVGAALTGVVVALRSSAWLPLWVGSAALAFHQGLLQMQQLGAAELPTVVQPDVIRLAVATSLAQFVWTSGAALMSSVGRSPVGRPAGVVAGTRPLPSGREVPS